MVSLVNQTCHPLFWWPSNIESCCHNFSKVWKWRIAVLTGQMIWAGMVVLFWHLGLLNYCRIEKNGQCWAISLNVATSCIECITMILCSNFFEAGVMDNICIRGNGMWYLGPYSIETQLPSTEDEDQPVELRKAVGMPQKLAYGLYHQTWAQLKQRLYGFSWVA